jgi:hypothetical protein
MSQHQTITNIDSAPKRKPKVLAPEQQKRGNELAREKRFRLTAEGKEVALAKRRLRHKVKPPSALTRAKNLEREKNRYQRKREQILAYVKEWNAQNREHRLAYLREYYLTHKAEMDAATVEWRRNNPEKAAAINRKRKARNRNAEGSHTAEDIQAIWHRQGRKCAISGCTHPISSTGKHKYHVDHIRALINDGTNWPDNLQCLCSTHNLQKNRTDEYEFAQRHGMLFFK